MDKKLLAQQLRKMSQPEQGMTINIKLDLSSLAQALRQPQEEQKNEYQKIDGLSPSPS